MEGNCGWLTAKTSIEYRDRMSKRSFIPELLIDQERWDIDAIYIPEADFNYQTEASRLTTIMDETDGVNIFMSEGAGLETIVREIQTNGETIPKDAFGHKQLGGVAPQIASIINSSLGYKYHWAVSDYLQRSARHIASQTDLEQAYSVGQAAIELVLKGQNAVMPIIKRKNTKKYSWEIDKVSLSRVANKEKKMPRSFITKDGFGITRACKKYLNPLIQGEAYPPYKNGIPVTANLKNRLLKKKLRAFKLPKK